MHMEALYANLNTPLLSSFTRPLSVNTPSTSKARTRVATFASIIVFRHNSSRIPQCLQDNPTRKIGGAVTLRGTVNSRYTSLIYTELQNTGRSKALQGLFVWGQGSIYWNSLYPRFFPSLPIRSFWSSISSQIWDLSEADSPRDPKKLVRFGPLGCWQAQNRDRFLSGGVMEPRNKWIPLIHEPWGFPLSTCSIRWPRPLADILSRAEMDIRIEHLGRNVTSDQCIQPYTVYFYYYRNTIQYGLIQYRDL